MIDLYLPKYNIAVECNEYNHRDIDPVYEAERQRYIEDHLNCRFLRFNLDSRTFNIFTVIGTLHSEIIKVYQCYFKEEVLINL